MINYLFGLWDIKRITSHKLTSQNKHTKTERPTKWITPEKHKILRGDQRSHGCS